MHKLLRSPHMQKHPIPYQYYLVEVGRKPYCQEREYMQMELRLPHLPICQPPANPCKITQVREAELDACFKTGRKGKKGKGKKKKKGKKK